MYATKKGKVEYLPGVLGADAVEVELEEWGKG
jgi:hypothetical protein